ncbi:uncharacterized protein LOC115346494 isoform X6 [Aquila chrysaetos chrysaetos]|uniref:uncharacterized protein LOC115346494 isoform X6 n=1 Tax=Aquila chrysaetos chrysaetos TaxID=223781 RepID=UPI001B7D3CCC|nr:uncharacterized protein LOC115346494 isoform X6 [Aquila chrysaetos chrysaetos]
MEVRLAGGFLRLLLLAWLRPAELAYLFSATIDVSVGLDLVLQCLLQTGLSSTAGEVKWFNTTQNEQNKGGVEMKNGSAQLVFTSVSKAHTGTYACRMENMRNMSRNRCSQQKECGGQPGKSVITMECMFQILLENHTVHVKSWYKDAGLEVGSQTNTTALGENCTNVTGTGMHAANMEICGCAVFITTINLTGTVNGTQGTVPSCGLGRHQSNVTEETWTGFCWHPRAVGAAGGSRSGSPTQGCGGCRWFEVWKPNFGKEPSPPKEVMAACIPAQWDGSSRVSL